LLLMGATGRLCFDSDSVEIQRPLHVLGKDIVKWMTPFGRMADC
jgi:hypothetical protein